MATIPAMPLAFRRRNAGRHAYPYRRANEEALTTIRQPKHRRDVAVVA